MTYLTTSSFQLATYEQGNDHADKLALVLPGRLDTKDYPHTRSHVDFLASLGFYAISFDPPGVWESPGDITLYTMTNYLRAIHELIELFGNKPTVLVGHSRGGTMAMLGGITNSHVTHIVAAMSRPSASKPENTNVLQEHAPDISYRDLPFDTTGNKKRFELPYSYFEDAARYDVSEDLKLCTKPKLFFYGTEDAIITPEIVWQTYQTSANPKYIHELVSDHDYRKHPDIIEEVNQAIGVFLSREVD